MTTSLIGRLVKWRSRRALGFCASKILLHYYGLDLPRAVVVGEGVSFPHTGRGTVIHPSTLVGDDVTIYHGVTVGRRLAHLSEDSAPFGGVQIDSGAVLFAGCCVLGGEAPLRVGQGTLIAANAVLTKSTGVGEIWGGVPARFLGMRP